ncbi:MAG TPA: CAP domain-containing protein [Solirubrobacteraceae bacterium]
MIRKLNAIRAQSGVRRLRSSRRLDRAADAKSGSVAATGDFSHGDVRGRVARFVRARSIGETMAWVSPEQGDDADAIVGSWMASGLHRDTLLSGQFARIGVARRSGTVAGWPAVVFTVDLASAR